MNTRVRKLVSAAVVGAAYAALTMLLAPISYGAVQFRLSEALCVLPFFMPWTAWGLFAGCAIANLLSAAGVLDVVFGSLATLTAGLLTAAWGQNSKTRRREPWEPETAQGLLWRMGAACLMPVVINGAVVGAVLAYTLAPGAFWGAFALIGAQVAAGEAAVLYIIGLPLLRWLPKWKFFAGYVGSFN